MRLAVIFERRIEYVARKRDPSCLSIGIHSSGVVRYLSSPFDNVRPSDAERYNGISRVGVARGIGGRRSSEELFPILSIIRSPR